MFSHKNSYRIFGKVITNILIGAIIGILAGFALGLLVWGLNLVVILQENIKGQAPAQIYTMLGMGWGAVIGGVFGGVIALKEK
jgi:hypothetical protein